MTISYNWLNDYLPQKLDPETLSGILTSIGLEVETLEKYEEVKGGLKGLLIGEVLEVTPHPDADRLKVTRVDIGAEDPLQIVCGAPNVAAGQKVVVAPVGITIYSVHGDELTLKKAKIRGEESQGMICAEDEIGLGENHKGILVLDQEAKAGTRASEYFHPAEDWIYEIGLTPNRMDAMSHLGVARDVCAWMSNEEGKEMIPKVPQTHELKADNQSLEIEVTVENQTACPRYAGISLTGLQIGESPLWLKQRLQAIGVRPINNVVDITNFVLHECGQPLHAFDAQAISGKKIVVKNLPDQTPFVTLDKVSRKLDPGDLMICNAEEGMCIAGVFGGLHSGVTDQTTAIFLESAYFDPVSIRRTSFRHGLRTDAAIHFEKGVDISGVIYALKRAVSLLKEIGGARVSSHLVDIYPKEKKRTLIPLDYVYLRKLSGKKYAPEKVNGILSSLGFAILEKNENGLKAAVPFSKPDMSVAADLVEEIMRIDGYSKVAIPNHIRIAPALSASTGETYKEKIGAYLVNNGFYEIFTNSITNSSYYKKDAALVHLINNLSTDLDVLRPSLVETGLEAVAYNLNRKQEDLLFFEFGKTYTPGENGVVEKNMLALFVSGNKLPENWIQKSKPVDSYFLKSHIDNIFLKLGLKKEYKTPENIKDARLKEIQEIWLNDQPAGVYGKINKKGSSLPDIRQDVWYAELDWSLLHEQSKKTRIIYKEIPRYPFVRRDLALILDKSVPFAEVEQAADSLKSNILEKVNLFDVFESEKLGKDKKSYAVSFIFRHPERTLTDKEIDKVMTKLITLFGSRLNAEIRS